MVHGVESCPVEINWYFPILLARVDAGFSWALLVVPYNIYLLNKIRIALYFSIAL